MNAVNYSLAILSRAIFWTILIFIGLLNASICLSILYFLISTPWNSFAFGILFIACMIFFTLAPGLFKSDREAAKKLLAVFIIITCCYALFIHIGEMKPSSKLIIQEEKQYPYDQKTILKPLI